MIKSELIADLAAENTHLTQRDIERVVGVIFERIITALEAGGRVELRGFGAFRFGPDRPGPGAIHAREQPFRFVPSTFPSSKAARS